MIIREALLSDYKGIAWVHVESWRSSYENLIPPHLMEELDCEQREDLWKKILLHDKVWVVEDRDQIVGFVHGGLTRSNNYMDYQGEIYALYILSGYQGLGLGKMLIRTLIEDLSKQNIASLLVSVFEEDSQCHFYETLGAEKIDSVEVDLEGQRVKEAVYGWMSLPQI
ncbi:GNAT family N-acetyltransferase [Filobacillus milosensis]|uniref:GNAT family N-acetyltransferase n=1 Tax=Filobacillus milosensis TaxID=94137 RepID=A0A4Y8INX8_9BACI|nr:GNAT family N-acetyltransferase [Filobacillus milosensis]TFB21337.1 GNAT family N-acetyltransferase [Filobacillus milosensis]